MQARTLLGLAGILAAALVPARAPALTVDSLGSTYARTLHGSLPFFPTIDESGSSSSIGPFGFDPGFAAFNAGDDTIGAGLHHATSVDVTHPGLALLASGGGEATSQIGRGAEAQFSEAVGSASSEFGLVFSILVPTYYTLTATVSSEFVLSLGSGLSPASAGFEFRQLGGASILQIQAQDVTPDGLSEVLDQVVSGILAPGSYALSANASSGQELFASTPPIDGYSRAEVFFSLSVVPEPAIPMLLALGLAATCLARARTSLR